MPLFGIDFKRKNKPSGTFHVENLSKAGRGKHRSMSNGRLLGSAGSLLLGGFLCYSALHYLPAFMHTSKVIAFTNADTSAARLHSTPGRKSIVAPYLELFKVRRTYLRPGQSIQVQYDMPRDAKLQLTIKRCANNFIVEVYKCEVVGERHVTVTNKTIGTQEFRFREGGFYMFDDKIVRSAKNKKDYQVIWRRG